MKFKKKKERLGRKYYVGEKGNFKFYYSRNYNGWYAVVNHIEKDIRYNSLWENIQFSSEFQVQQWCEDFDYKKHECLGKDV